MTNTFLALNGLPIVSNKAGDKVEQKQSRAIKNELMVALTKEIASLGFEIMYDKDSPVAVLDNGLIIGFDFIIKGLDTELSVSPTAKPKAPKKAE
jgi:hypothetical protein